MKLEATVPVSSLGVFREIPYTPTYVHTCSNDMIRLDSNPLFPVAEADETPLRNFFSCSKIEPALKLKQKNFDN
jgi:hypothetical protein